MARSVKLLGIELAPRIFRIPIAFSVNRSFPISFDWIRENMKHGFEFRTRPWTFEVMGVQTKVTHVVDPDGVQVELIEV